MSTDITPAMTEAQWRAFLADDSMSEDEITNIRYYAPGEVWFNSEYQIPHPHACAAALLYGQPFGFTREDVADERMAYTNLVLLARQAQDMGDESLRLDRIEQARRHYERANKIAALLPPQPIAPQEDSS